MSDMEKLVERLREENGRLHEWMAEIQMNAHMWMKAHDKLKAGKPYDLPKPADLPDAIQSLMEQVDALEGVIFRNCDPFDASEADAAIIKRIADDEFARIEASNGRQ